MTQIGIMIEGQDGLNWTRWERILKAAEDFGYQCVFRSDHFTNASGDDKDSLELWVSLTYAATHTSRIEFGSLVAPTTFRHPSMTARMAAAVDDLSGERLILGLGAGWQEREHHKFGVPFYDMPTRYEMLTDALEMTTRLFSSDAPVTYEGQHFSLKEAVLLPRPKRKTPILIGGNGMTKTLPLAAKYADEWNGVYLTPEFYKERITALDGLLAKEGRKPGDVKRSLMTQLFYAENDADLIGKLDTRGSKLDDLLKRGMIAGTPSMIVDQIGKYVEVGVERFMLQWLQQDNIADLEKIARDILPKVQK